MKQPNEDRKYKLSKKLDEVCRVLSMAEGLGEKQYKDYVKEIESCWMDTIDTTAKNLHLKFQMEALEQEIRKLKNRIHFMSK